MARGEFGGRKMEKYIIIKENDVFKVLKYGSPVGTFITREDAQKYIKQQEQEDRLGNVSGTVNGSFGGRKMELKPDEVFKEFLFNDSFKVSQYGRVMSKNGEIIEPKPDYEGYLYVEDPEKAGKIEYVHKLVALTWLKGDYKKGKGMVVHHRNKRITDNQARNLRWMHGKAHAYMHHIKGCYVDDNGHILPEVAELYR